MFQSKCTGCLAQILFLLIDWFQQAHLLPPDIRVQKSKRKEFKACWHDLQLKPNEVTSQVKEKNSKLASAAIVTQRSNHPSNHKRNKNSKLACLSCDCHPPTRQATLSSLGHFGGKNNLQRLSLTFSLTFATLTVSPSCHISVTKVWPGSTGLDIRTCNH